MQSASEVPVIKGLDNLVIPFKCPSSHVHVSRLLSQEVRASLATLHPFVGKTSDRAAHYSSSKPFIGQGHKA